MKHIVFAAAAAALVLGGAGVAEAQTKGGTQPTSPGASTNAPGQKQKEPGQAKTYAPGQKEKIRDKDKLPGAKEYAPGRQEK